MEKMSDLKVNTITREEIINRLLDLMNDGVKLTDEQIELLKELST
jgi:hypothetical protein